MDDVMPPGPIPRPYEKEFETLSLDELLRAEDRTDKILFLISIDELMSSISDQYQVVARVQADYQQLSIPPQTIVESYLEAAVATNMAIQQVQTLEMELLAQHEHLTTPYRALALLALPEIVQHLATLMQKHASKACSAQDITIFLGDVLECHFRNVSDKANRKDTLVQEFCSTYQIDASGTTELKNLFEAIRELVLLEVPISIETKNRGMMVGLLNSMKQAVGALPQSHSWLLKMPFIGGDRSILHTLRLLQIFGNIISTTPHNKRMQAGQPGFFGPPFQGAQKFHPDMDELLMTKILPEWVMMCRHGILSKQKMPREDELCPLFVQIR
eukprot:3719106-Ditylum_brightwellii.AAC.1